MNNYDKLDSECYWGRHKFTNGFCTLCGVDQNKVVKITGRRWFAKSAGNTYHSVVVTMPDGATLRNPYEYGYDRQFEDTALALIREHLGIPKQDGDQLSPFLAVHGFVPDITALDVGRKRDL